MNKIITSVPNRKNSNSVKWDGMKPLFGCDDLLPLWVADMDFKIPQFIIDALKERVEHGIFGYVCVHDGYWQSFMDWQERRYSYKLKREDIRFAPGIVPALYWFVQLLTQPCDSCLILEPVYYPFMGAIKDNGRKLITSSLQSDENGYYSIDFKDVEQKITDHKVKLFIFCSPHNPVSRVWRKNEIKQLMEICKKHDVYVISDEIHQDLIMDKNLQHIPTNVAGDYADFVITMTSASKTFNIAGLRNSFIIIHNDEVRKSFDDFALKNKFQNANVFGYLATELAYNQGEEWLAELIATIHHNYKICQNWFWENLPKAIITPLEATYLMWIDLGAYIEAEETEDIIKNQCQLALDYGHWFYDGKNSSHIRINIATSTTILQQCLGRLKPLFSRI